MPVTNDLKVFMIAARTDLAGAAVSDVDQEEMRLLASFLLGEGYGPNAVTGLANPDAFKVRQDTGSNMSVRVGNGTLAARDLYAVRGEVAGQGTYIARLDAAYSTVVAPTSDASQSCVYGVFLFIDDATYSGTASRRRVGLSVLRNTPGVMAAPSPSVVWSASVLLWTFTLGASASAITNAILDAGTDGRVPSALAATSENVGRISEYASLACVPIDHLVCDGASYLRATYPLLFSKISTAWGSADGTHFNVPDLRGRTTIGSGTGSGLTARTVAQLVGTETHVLSSGEMPSHTHVQDAHTHVQPAHGHTQNSHTHTQDAHSHTIDLGIVPYDGGAVAAALVADVGAVPEHPNTSGLTDSVTPTISSATATNQNTTATNNNTTATNQNTGGGTAHQNMQPSAVVVKAIKAY